MKASSNQEEYIERYLRQELTKDERRIFEQRLEEDPNLRAEVSLHRDLTAGIHLSGSEDLKRKLQTVGRINHYPSNHHSAEISG